mmetsp:Transcript_10862/g.21486  ORF Transcript_10862/g.21486 Transcript_10862/m.21486 type:complete len:241 (+) Transcript_10862:453-1175(+)
MNDDAPIPTWARLIWMPYLSKMHSRYTGSACPVFWMAMSSIAEIGVFCSKSSSMGSRSSSPSSSMSSSPSSALSESRNISVEVTTVIVSVPNFFSNITRAVASPLSPKHPVVSTTFQSPGHLLSGTWVMSGSVSILISFCRYFASSSILFFLESETLSFFDDLSPPAIPLPPIGGVIAGYWWAPAPAHITGLTAMPSVPAPMPAARDDPTVQAADIPLRCRSPLPIRDAMPDIIQREGLA